MKVLDGRVGADAASSPRRSVAPTWTTNGGRRGLGIAAMPCAILGLPLTSVLLTTLFLGSDGAGVIPLVIVAVVVAYVGRAYFSPQPAPTRHPTHQCPTRRRLQRPPRPSNDPAATY